MEVASEIMKYHIILSDAERKTFDLCYDVFQHRVAKEWVNLSQKSLDVGALPSGASFNFQVTPNDFQTALDEMNGHIGLIQVQGEIDIPIERLTQDNLSQKYLNDLHEQFHRFEEESRKHNHFSPTRDALGQLNVLIHWVENAYKMLSGTHINQFLTYYLHPNHFSPLNDSDYELARISLNFGDLMLGYGTTGKNLYHCYIDNDRKIVEDGLIRPQKTISTEVLAFFPLQDAAPSFEKEQNERFQNWCKEADVSKYGYDISEPQHRIGHIPLGKLTQKLSLEEIKEVFGRFNRVSSCYFSS